MGFPQYLIPPPFCQMKSQLSDTSLYPAVPSPACFGQQYCSLLLLVQGECLWIIWLCNLGDQVHLQNQRHLKLSAGFLVVYVDFATFLSGRRKTAACLLFSFFAGCDEAECAVQCVPTLETTACPAFLPPIAPWLPNWVVLHGALDLGLCFNCPGTTRLTAVALGSLVSFFRLSSRLCLMVASLNRSPTVSVLRE